MLSSEAGGEALLHYICHRGDEREIYWAEYNSKVDPKSKGKAKAAKTKVDPVLGFSLPFEPEGAIPDPNHGPGSKLWRKLLEVISDDDYSVSKDVTLLVASMLNRVDEIASLLLEKRVSINAHDGAGLTPLMYALLFRNEEQLQALLVNGADADSLSANGDPVIKFVFIHAEVYAWHAPNFLNETRTINWRISYYDALRTSEYIDRVLQTLVDRGVDLLVSDSDGNGPLHYALGLINSKLSLSGEFYGLSGFVYPEESETLRPLLSALCKAGADPNASNGDGVCPLHVAAAISDTDAIELLLSLNANPNPLDCNEYHPLHYLCGAGRNKSLAGFYVLLTKGSFRPLERMSDRVTRDRAMPKHDRDTLELRNYIRDSFAEAVCPGILTKRRLTPIELAGLRTRRNLNLIHLSLSGHLLSNEPFAKYAEKNKRIRLRLVDCIHKIDGFSHSQFYSCVDDFGLSIHHAYSTLFHEPMDTDFYPNRPKVKGKKPLSMEYEIISNSLFHNPSALYSRCGREIGLLSPEIKDWTPLHGAIANRNSELIRYILQQSFDNSCVDYIHLASKGHLSPESTEELLKHIILQSDCRSMLNGPSGGFLASPLHLAVRTQNADFIRAACKHVEFDINARDDLSGLTPFYEACLNGNDSTLSAFSEAVDRIDLFSTNDDGKTCLEAAIELNRLEAVNWLLENKYDDCIKILMRNSVDGGSLLFAMERDHFQLLKIVKKMAMVAEDEVRFLGEGNDGVHQIDEENPFPVDRTKLVESSRILLRILSAIHSNGSVGFDHFHPIYSPETFVPAVFSL